MIEYRICWNASSNASFQGSNDWTEWHDEDASVDEVEKALSDNEIIGKPYNVPPGLEEALGCSGFEWWVEAREVA